MEIVFGQDPWIQASALSLRYEVFVLEQKIPAKLEFDALDEPSRWYFLALVDGLPAGTLRFQQKSSLIVQPDRFCVKKTYRQRGIGTRLLQACEKVGQQIGCQTAELSAELTAQSFYQKLGYHIASAPFYEDGILCVSMTKKLS